MPDTVLDLPRLRLWLAEAELALHNLSIGRSSQSVGYEGKSVTYTQANRNDLLVHISGLRDRIAVLEGGARTRRRPIHMTF